jgi:hypothetical protein
LIARPPLAASDIGGEVGIFVEDTRHLDPLQHFHHHQVAGAERAVEPVGIAETCGKLAEPATDTVLDQRQAIRGPGLVAFPKFGGLDFEDRRLDRVERGEHPADRARPGIGIVGQQAGMMLGDVEDDRAGFEQDEIAFLIGGNLAEGMERQMRGLLHRGKGNEAHLIGQARFFERPANAGIARQPLAAIG